MLNQSFKLKVWPSWNNGFRASQKRYLRTLTRLPHYFPGLVLGSEETPQRLGGGREPGFEQILLKN